MRRSITIVLAGVLVAGCTADTRTFTGLHTDLATSRFGGAILVIPKNKDLAKCPSELDATDRKGLDQLQSYLKAGRDSEEAAIIAAPLVAAGISIAASYIVSSIDTALEEYKKGLSGTFGAAGVHEKALSDTACIIVARGHLGTPKKQNVENPNQGEHLSWLAPALGFADYPAFYLELRARTDGDKLIVQPVFLSYPQSIARNDGPWWRMKKKKQVSIALALSESSAKKTDEIDEEKAIAIFRLHLGELEIGKRYKKQHFASVGASANPKSNQLTTSGYNIMAIVSDSEDPTLSYQILASTFTSKKADLEKALIDTITNAVNGAQKKD